MGERATERGSEKEIEGVREQERDRKGGDVATAKVTGLSLSDRKSTRLNSSH